MVFGVIPASISLSLCALACQRTNCSSEDSSGSGGVEVTVPVSSPSLTKCAGRPSCLLAWSATLRRVRLWSADSLVSAASSRSCRCSILSSSRVRKSTVIRRRSISRLCENHLFQKLAATENIPLVTCAVRQTAVESGVTGAETCSVVGSQCISSLTRTGKDPIADALSVLSC